MLDFTKAMACGFRVRKERKSRMSHQNTYILHMSNVSDDKNPRTLQGSTIRGLINEFISNHAQFTYAVITKLGNDEKYLRYYNRNEGKKFISLVSKRRGTK